MSFSINNFFRPSQVSPLSSPDKTKQGEKTAEVPAKPTNSYQDQVKLTQADQKARLAQAREKATATKLRDRAAQLVSARTNSDAAAFEATATSWNGAKEVKGAAAVEEVVASYMKELENKDKKIFDSAAMAKAIALIEHERDFIRNPQSSASASRANIFPDIKDKNAALNEAIAELFKAVNHTDKDGALESFKNVGSGELHSHALIAAQTAASVEDLLGNLFDKGKETGTTEGTESILEGVKSIEADSILEWIKSIGTDHVDGLKEQLEALNELAKGDPTATAIIEALKIASMVGMHVLSDKAEKNAQYFKGAEELAPTIVPKKTASVEKAKDILSASLGTKKLADANEVDARLIEATQKGKVLLAKKKGSSTSSLQLMQKEMSEKNKVLVELRGALEDGKRVIQAEQDYKSASRNEKIDGPGSNMKKVKHAQQGVALGSMIASVCGAGMAAPAAALALNNLILTAYHFGGGAVGDGVEKMTNILESTLKSDDLIDTSQISRRQIANLYGEYEKTAKKFGEGSPEEVAARKGLQTALEGKIKIDVIHDALQTPVALRMENGKKLFEGKIAKNLEKAKKLKGDFAGKDAQKIKEDLRKNLTDLANINAAQSLIDEAMQIEDKGEREAAMNKAYEKASQLLAKVDNKDFQTLFTGTLRQQLKALKTANQEYTGATSELEKIKKRLPESKLAETNATLGIQFKEGESFEIGDETTDQLLKHGAVPKALNLPLPKLNGGIRSVDVSLANTNGYYKQHVKMQTFSDKVKVKGKYLIEEEKKFANSLFGTASKATIAHINLRSTREARHRLPDDILEAQAVLAQLQGS